MIAQLLDATWEVLETMSLARADSWEACAAPAAENGTHMTGMVGLAGSFSGMLAIHCREEVAADLASRMLGTDTRDPAVVQDAIGEVANMVAGAFKLRLARRGDRLNISLPTVIAGRDFRIESPSSSRRQTRHIATDIGDLFLDLIIENGQPA